jgi:hypothetical protein
MRIAAGVGFVDALQAVTESPELVAVSVLLAAALVIAGWLVVILLRKTPGEQFQRVLQEVGEVAVLMHPNPDPDAMSCALAVQELARNRGTEAGIYYPGQIRHHENRAFETVLDVDFEHIEQAKEIENEITGAEV